MLNTREQDWHRNQRVSPLRAVMSVTPDTPHHGHGGGVSSSWCCFVTGQLAVEAAGRHVPTVCAAVVDGQRYSRTTTRPGQAAFGLWVGSVASRTTAVPRTVPVLAVQIPQSSLYSRFCTGPFQSTPKTKSV